MVTDSRKDGRRETKAERYGPESIELGSENACVT